MLPDYYKILGLAHTAEKDEIRRAYLGKVRAVHPDVNPSAEAHKEFILLKEAYDTLSDENKRVVYDMKLKQAATTKRSVKNFHYDYESNFGRAMNRPRQEASRYVLIAGIAAFLLALAAGAVVFFLKIK